MFSFESDFFNELNNSEFEILIPMCHIYSCLIFSQNCIDFDNAVVSSVIDQVGNSQCRFQEKCNGHVRNYIELDDLILRIHFALTQERFFIDTNL